MTGLQRYFEDEVVQLQNRLAEEVRAKVAKQQQQQQQRDSSGPVVFLGGGGGAIIPELHFPNSADGGGMLEHATPQLDAGMQVKERLACVLAGEKVGGVRSLVLLVGGDYWNCLASDVVTSLRSGDAIPRRVFGLWTK